MDRPTTIGSSGTSMSSSRGARCSFQARRDAATTDEGRVCKARMCAICGGVLRAANVLRALGSLDKGLVIEAYVSIQ
jgi:hypothetical protein